VVGVMVLAKRNVGTGLGTSSSGPKKALVP
jgi:hypothetical protein